MNKSIGQMEFEGRKKISVSKRFETAVALVQSLPKKGPYQPSYSDAGKVYSFYKQSKFGPCTDPRPGFWDVINRAKWDAWTALGDMPQETAMLKYIDEVKRIYEQVRSNEEFSQREEEFADSIVPFCLAVNVDLSPSLKKYASKYDVYEKFETETYEEDNKSEAEIKSSAEELNDESLSDNVVVELDSSISSNLDRNQLIEEETIGEHLTTNEETLYMENEEETKEESSDEEEIYCDSLTDQTASSMSANVVIDDVKEVSSSEDVVTNIEVIRDSDVIKSICKSNSSSEESRSEFEIVEKFTSSKPKTVRYADSNDSNKKTGDAVNKMKGNSKKVPPSNVLISVPKSCARRLLYKSRLAKVPVTQPASYASLEGSVQSPLNEDISNESDSSVDMTSSTPDDIAFKIVKSLSRIEIVLKQVAQRLETVNKNMEKRNEIISSRYWWQKYLPSKFHIFAVAWPILLNLIIYIYWRKKRKSGFQGKLTP